MIPREVWVTGAGVISAAGRDQRALRDTLLAGKSALRFDSELGCLVGRSEGEYKSPVSRRLDRSARLFLGAAEEAWADSGLENSQLDPRRCALIEGSSLGPLSEVLREHRRWIAAAGPPRPSRLIQFMTGAGGALMAQIHGIRGPVLHLSAASVSAVCAIGEGIGKIRSGSADMVIVGGAESPLDHEVVETFRAAGILANEPNGAPLCRPFDYRRSGTVLGEGAGVFILEAAAHAAARGARARVRLGGFGLACEHFSLTGPDPAGTGISEAAEQALQGLDRHTIGWVKTHGTGTRSNDAAECAGLTTIFDNQLTHLPITSLKSTVGHSLGASGAVEAVATMLCMEAGVIPATLETETPDRRLPPVLVATEIRECAAERVLLLAESFGGRCAALVLERMAD